MSDNEDLYTETRPELAQFIRERGLGHQMQLARWLSELGALGATRNELASALAHWNALSVDAALQLLERPITAEIADDASWERDPGLLAAKVFGADVLIRVMAIAQHRREAS